MAESLKALLGKCKTINSARPSDDLKDRTDMLDAAGFVVASRDTDIKYRLSLVSEYKYKAITDKAIESFIGTKLVRLANNNMKQFHHKVRFQKQDVEKREYYFSRAAYDTTFCGEWKEENIEKYNGCPPANVLKILVDTKKRNIFHYFTIGSVVFDRVKIKDPLLLGRINSVEDRFFISQWGDDVQLDDLI